MQTLKQCPTKGSLPALVPTDPLIYRFYEIMQVYGTTIKEVIHEEFGDGIISAIDFTMDVRAGAQPAGGSRPGDDGGQVPALQEVVTFRRQQALYPRP